MNRIINHLTMGFGCAAVLLALPALSAGQEPPPIGGVNGTIALDGTVDQTYKAANTVIVKTVDGVRHLFHLTGKTAVHGGEATELKTMEGVVTRVDRAARKITIRLADGSIQTLRLSDRAATDAGKDVDRAAADTTKVVVYYSDEAGERVAHYFKRIS